MATPDLELRAAAEFKANTEKNNKASNVAEQPTVVTRKMSTMRASTVWDRFSLKGTPEEVKKRIIEHREVFKWLPALCSNDLVHGSWWYLWGSLISMIIPIFPLISLYEGFWPEADVHLPKTEHVAVYVLLIVLGFFYTVGSYAFLRAVETPEVEPIFTCYHFGSDELFGMWMFTLGTMPAIPLLAMYAYYNNGTSIGSQFKLALALTVFFEFLFFLATFACYPSYETPAVADEEATGSLNTASVADTNESGGKKSKDEPVKLSAPKQYIAPYILCCLPDCCCTWLKFHLSNDWLVVSWGCVVGCIFAIIMCIGMLIHAAHEKEARGIFDYATGLGNMLFFLIGSVYFAAGSHAMGDQGGIHGLEHQKGGKYVSADKNEEFQTADTVASTAMVKLQGELDA